MPTITRWPRHVKIPQLPAWVDEVDLTADTAADYTVPAGVNRVLISSPTAVVYARLGGDAAVPSGDTVDGTGSYCLGNSASFAVEPGQVISLISSSNCNVQIGSYLDDVGGLNS